MQLPKVALVEYYFDPQRIEDIPAEVGKEMQRLRLQEKIRQGDSVAISAGSRGIANIHIITSAVVNDLK